MAVNLAHVILCVCTIGAVLCLSEYDFYPYGPGRDHRLEDHDEASSDEIPLRTRIVFFDRPHRSLFVNANGLVSFETDISNYANIPLPMNVASIAAFYADIDTTVNGQIYYRESQEPADLQKATSDVRKHFNAFADFEATSVCVVTWDRVGHYQGKSDMTNTFQLVLITNERDSFAILNYLDQNMRWIRGGGKNPNLEDAPGQIGFDSGDGRHWYKLPGSGTARVDEINRNTNVGKRGQWMFQIGNLRSKSIMEPDLIDGVVQEVLTVNEHHQHTCAQGADECHINARCVDHNPGYCCECAQPFIGNGHSCIEPNKPQRVNGKATGEVNGRAISADLHAYIVTGDGRAYTAISRVPAEIGLPLSLLTPAGSAIGWMFAVSVSKARNGFELTGGNFNRTAIVRFSDGGESISIRESFIARDVANYMRMTTEIVGDVPLVLAGSSIAMDDYVEDFRRVESGLIKSFSTHKYRVDDVPFTFTVEQTITLDECSFEYAASDAGPPPLRLSVSRNFVVFDEREQIVRYAQTNKISPLTDDPCERSNCAKAATCVVEEDSFRCVCNEGYEGDGEECTDIDECRLRLSTCDPVKSVCINMPGTYECHCAPGYEGDGRACEAVPPSSTNTCEDIDCDENADCVMDYDIREPMCQCREGYEGDGSFCALDPGQITRPTDAPGGEMTTCDDIDCDANADCVIDHRSRQPSCVCRQGYVGDGSFCALDPGQIDRPTGGDGGRGGSGIVVAPAGDRVDEYDCRQVNTCGEHADCAPDYNLRRYTCQCLAGYVGDGFNCAEEAAAVSAAICSTCHQSANCVLGRVSQQFVCQCKNGYEGDGFRCQLTLGHTCDVRNDCNTNAQCVYDQVSAAHACVCRDGFTGDGYTCTEEASAFDCGECSPLAECKFDDHYERYYCECPPGYSGDGYTCTFNTPAYCLQGPDVGPCTAEIDRWYFNQQNSRCEGFVYGGCVGNHNNFASKDDCELRCGKHEQAVVEEVKTEPPVDTTICLQPVDSGPCRASIPRFYYNSQVQLCAEYLYGGCDGNENNFETAQECMHHCSGVVGPVATLAPVDKFCPDLRYLWYCPVDTPCEADSDCPVGQWCCDVDPCSHTICIEPTEIRPGPPLDICPEGTPLLAAGGDDLLPCSQCPGTHFCFTELADAPAACCPKKTATRPPLPAVTVAPPVENVCSLPSMVGPCRGAFLRWAWDSDNAECVEFVYGGCEGNGNKFETQSECEASCVAGEIDICRLPAVVGPCRARESRWFFNADSQSCESFIYGGCQGNGNNFAAAIECQARCGGSELSCDVVNICDFNAACQYDFDMEKHACVCNPGYEGDGKTCTDARTCNEVPTLCDVNADCVHDAASESYHCRCRQGFRGNGKRCADADQLQGEFLLYGHGMSVMQIPYEPTEENRGRQATMVPGEIAVALDVDCQERYFYWTDQANGNIRRATYDGKDSRIIIAGLKSPEGIAIDWVSRNMYWTDAELDTIEVAKLDGTSRKVLVATELVNPRAIAVEPYKGRLFWSDWNRENPRIETSWMDGDYREDFVTGDLSLPNALTIDFNNEELCWGDAGTHRIECIGLEGSGRRIVYSIADYPFGLTNFGDSLYWTDWDSNELNKVNKLGGLATEMKPRPLGGNGRLYGIVAVKSTCPRATNACAQRNGGCDSLCLPTPHNGRTCACPDDNIGCQRFFFRK